MDKLATGAFEPAILRVLKIAYRCDLARENGLTIPLGVLADMRAGDSYVMGLVARTSLSSDEVNQVGALIRAELSKPFAYLVPIFDDAMQSARTASPPGSAFEALQDMHCHSLVFEMTDGALQVELPRAAKVSAAARELWLKDELHSHGNAAYWEMFGSKVPELVQKESKDVAA
jgi:hypothetical protein